MPAHAALQYTPASFDTRVGKMMGRQVAGEAFLRAWAQYAGADPLTGFVYQQEDAEAFKRQLRELGHEDAIQLASPAAVQPLADAGAFWLSDPVLGPHAWRRRALRQNQWSLIGITHTISTGRTLDAIGPLLTTPVQPWDALICTSRAVHAAVVALLTAQADYLVDRLGAQRCEGPQLPIIPLGVHCEDFAPDPAARARWRTELGLEEQAVAVLQFGRIGFHAKAHPLPLYLALEQAMQRPGSPQLHLILAGQFANAAQEVLYRELASAFADRIPTHFVDGKRADAASVRAAADIATLLSDNIQESFGLAPVEAMAAGLPVVGSDWDGLRDTIVHGETGFLIETLTPPPGAGLALANRHLVGLDTDDMLQGSAAQSTAVDIGQAAEAFATLAADRALRLEMGAAGRRRADMLFSWRVVIAQYLALLDALAERRQGALGERAPRKADASADPMRPDPFAAFAGHASGAIAPAMLVTRGPNRLSPTEIVRHQRNMTIAAPAVLPGQATLETMLACADRGASVGDLLALFPAADPAHLYRGIAWLLKNGFLSRS